MASQDNQTAARARRKSKIGVVTSNKMMKTIVVRVDRLTRHPLYTRTVAQSSSFKAHDEANEAKIGDIVEIMETRPLSKDKRWRLVKIVRRASTAPPVPMEESEQPKPERDQPAAAAGPVEEAQVPA